MKMRLKSRQTTVSTTPTTASADITENRMTSIKITSSLGIPSGYRGDGRGGEREREVDERGGRVGGGEGEGEKEAMGKGRGRDSLREDVMERKGRVSGITEHKTSVHMQ